MKVLVTDADSMLGRYLCREFRDEDLVKANPADRAGMNEALDLVVACGQPESLPELLRNLENKPPRYLVVVSGHEVYGEEEGESLGENSVGPGKGAGAERWLMMEKEAVRWHTSHPDTVLTILRPARMFGKGLSGDMARMFSEVVAGRYVHIRGEEARVSIVTALDVARAVRRLYLLGGVYNLCDDRPVTWLQLAEAMSANAGKYRRPTVLPAPWARAAYRFLGWLPVVREQLDPARLQRRSVTQVLDNTRAKEAGVGFFDTLAVIRREEKEYPYEDV